MKISKTEPRNISGERIRAERKRQGLSQQKLAEITREQGFAINYNKISKIETGKRFVSDYELIAFSRALHVSISFLLGEL